MKKRCLLVLVLTIVIAGAVFAQNDYEPMPKNTVTVDLGPTFFGAVIGVLGNSMGDEDASSSGFGIGVQYERQIQEKLTVSGKFTYLGSNFGIVNEEINQKTVLDFSLASFSLEGHVRYYPAGNVFFFDGMLGYAGMSAVFSGEFIEVDNGKTTKESISFSAYRSYIKFGVKTGWRIDFGKQGGFIFEPSLGYYGGLGLGDTIGKQLANNSAVNNDIGEVDEMFEIFENFIFIGGPRISLSFGWRF